jgi:hypothetical protein
MLGITSQGIHDLVAKGKLTRHESSGVTTSSLYDRINQRTAAKLRAQREG